MTTIFTIGYGNRKIDTVTNLLTEYGITLLVDVRSHPYSRFNPNYNKAAFQLTLQNIGIKYLYGGTELGGKPKDPSLYSDGKLNYETVNLSQSYNEVLDSIVNLAEDQTICLMCCELDPDKCHRKNLISPSLLKRNIQVLHIDQRGFIC